MEQQSSSVFFSSLPFLKCDFLLISIVIQRERTNRIIGSYGLERILMVVSLSNHLFNAGETFTSHQVALLVFILLQGAGSSLPVLATNHSPRE